MTLIDTEEWHVLLGFALLFPRTIPWESGPLRTMEREQYTGRVESHRSIGLMELTA